VSQPSGASGTKPNPHSESEVPGQRTAKAGSTSNTPKPEAYYVGDSLLITLPKGEVGKQMISFKAQLIG